MNENLEIIDTRILYLNSNSRTDINDNIWDCRYIIEPYIFDVNDDEYLEIQLSSFVSKFSWYNVDTDRNSEVFISIDNGATFSNKLTLPTGNYNVKEQAENIQALLRTITSDNIAVTWNKGKNKFKYLGDVVNVNNIILKFPENQTGYELWGFPRSATTLNLDKTRQLSIGLNLVDDLSNGVVSIGNEEALYINTDFSTNHNYQLREGSQSANQILAKVFIIAPPQGFVYYVASDYMLYTNHYPAGVSPKNEFRIRITDELGNPIKVPTDYQMTFRIIKRKKQKEITGLLKNLIKLQATNLIKKK